MGKVLLFCALMLVVFTGIFGSGCAGRTNRDPHGDWVFISDDAARRMGESAARQLEEQVGIYHSEQYNSYINNLGQRMAAYSDRPNLDYQFKILDSFMVNALALPGGFVYVTRGLLKNVDNEAQLAAVIGHELGHISAYHSEKRAQLQVGSILTSVAAAGATRGRSIIGGVVGTDMIARGYTRTAEYEADELGVEFLRRAGYYPRAMGEFLEKLREDGEQFPVQEILILRTHPFLEDRIRRLNMMLATAEFEEDYIVNSGRFNRYRRQYLFLPEEEQVLEKVEGMLNAYQRFDVSSMKKYFCDDFEIGPEDDRQSAENFLNSLKRRFERLEKIDYTYQLFDLDHRSDSEIAVIYSYREERQLKEESIPEIIDGYQKTVWKRSGDSWCLIRLQ